MDILKYIAIAFVVISVLRSIRTINQGTVGVTTIFGKYRRVLQPGLRFLIPFIEKIYTRISIQNRSTELEYQAITQDQANVYFKVMILWAAIDGSEDNIKKVAFKFRSDVDLKTALERSVEGSTRGLVALRKQAEILGLRNEIVNEVKEQLDTTLAEWGYHLIDLQINDIKFDERVTQSMAEVVASMNLKAAAIYEGEALLIKKTKEAEAEGASIRITAQAEKDAAELRGEGVALYREKVASGIGSAVNELTEVNHANEMIMFSMWTEALTSIAEKSKGNVIFFDGSSDSPRNDIKKLMSLSLREEEGMNDSPVKVSEKRVKTSSEINDMIKSKIKNNGEEKTVDGNIPNKKDGEEEGNIL